jgi:DNA-binding beta-propeller fold protein YncE
MSCVPATLQVSNNCLGSGFTNPFSVVVDRSGTAYVADSYDYAVKEVAPNGTITTLGVGFYLPAGVALDSVRDPLLRHAAYRAPRY